MAMLIFNFQFTFTHYLEQKIEEFPFNYLVKEQNQTISAFKYFFFLKRNYSTLKENIKIFNFNFYLFKLNFLNVYMCKQVNLSEMRFIDFIKIKN